MDAVNPSVVRPSKTASVDALVRLAAADMARVDALITERMDSPVPVIPALAEHLIAAGGKRLRPLLTLASARMCGYRGGRHHALAACVEFIHTATLLHDDVVDESDLRRGLATANALWGNKASVLVGDFLFSRAFQLMVSDGSLRVLEILSGASAVIAEGEVLQLVTSNDTDTSEQSYLDVIRCKTAALFAAACRIGAVVAERPKVEEEALDSYGLNLGIAFQLIDDMLDYSAKQAELGKTVGDDFREGKITLPVLVAFHSGCPAEQQFWQRTIETLEQRDEDLDEAMRLIALHGGIDATIERARRFAEEAREALLIFPDSPIRQAMIAASDYTVQRAR